MTVQVNSKVETQISVSCVCGAHIKSPQTLFKHLSDCKSLPLVRDDFGRFDILVCDKGSLAACKLCDWIRSKRPDRRKTILGDVLSHISKHYDDMTPPVKRNNTRHLCFDYLNPSVWTNPTKSVAQFAKLICSHCSQREKCIATAFKNREKNDIWGGINFHNKQEVEQIDLKEIDKLLKTSIGYIR